MLMVSCSSYSKIYCLRSVPNTFYVLYPIRAVSLPGMAIIWRNRYYLKLQVTWQQESAYYLYVSNKVEVFSQADREN
jgi:hypothetical protein